MDFDSCLWICVAEGSCGVRVGFGLLCCYFVVIL